MAVCRIDKEEGEYKICGVLTFETVTLLFKEGIELLAGNEEVCLDFSRVTHADSSSIALLLSWIRFAKQRGKTFIFANLPGQLFEIAQVCEVMPFLNQHVITRSSYSLE